MQIMNFAKLKHASVHSELQTDDRQTQKTIKNHIRIITWELPPRRSLLPEVQLEVTALACPSAGHGRVQQPS